jgi:hypothetical protein
MCIVLCNAQFSRLCMRAQAGFSLSHGVNGCPENGIEPLDGDLEPEQVS